MNTTRHARQGAFIVIEGVDGAGKGVQSQALHRAMLAQGLDVILSREPGGSPAAEEIRELLVAGAADKWDDISELLLIYAARRAHLRDTIWPAMAAGSWVICDRFADSSRAFQGLAGGLGLEAVERVHELVVGDFAPDLTLVLDLDPEVSLQRAQDRGGHEDRFEQKGLRYQQKVREGFRSLAAASPDTHVLIDASQGVATVTREVFRIVNQRFDLQLC